jgi:hypothetical protein
MSFLRLAAIAVLTTGLSSAPAMAQFADDNLDASWGFPAIQPMN